MPYTDQQIETLKATDPAIVKQAFAKMSEGQRSELFAAVEAYSGRKAAAPAPSAPPTEQPTPKGLIQGLIERSNQIQAKTKQELHEKGLFQAVLSRALDSPMPYSPGGLVRQVRQVFSDNPAALEKYLPDPTLAGIGKGLSDVVVAPAQLAAHVTGVGVPQMDRAADAVQGYYQRNYMPSKTGEMIGQTLPFVATGGASAVAQGPRAAGALARLANYGKGVAKGVISGGVLAPLLTPETNLQGDFAERKTNEAQIGAAVGGTGAALLPGVTAAAGKTADALAGTKLGRLLGIKTAINPKYAGAPELSAELDKAEITHTVGDITSDPKILSHEAAMARKDPRMMDLRVKQNQEGTAYADKIVSNLKDAVNTEGWQSLADVQAAAKSGGRRSGEAEKLLTAIQNSGDEWKRIAQTSGNMKLFVNKLKADQLFDTAEKIAAQYGPVPAKGTLNAAESAISTLTEHLGADSPNAPHMLQDIATKLGEGNQYSFAELRALRSKLNNKISLLTDPKSVSPPLDVELNAYKDVVKAIENDLDSFGNKHSSGMRNAWKTATNHYKEAVVPYKDAEMGKILADQDPLALGRLFQSKDRYAQQRMFGLMEPKGQAAVRAGIIEDAVSAGEKVQRGVNAPTQSAARVASALEKLEANGTMDVAFKGSDKWAVRGLGRLMRVIDKSDSIAWVPPTGEVMDRMGADVKGATTVIGAAEKGVNWLNKERLFQLYTNPKGKALLMRASSLQPGSKAMTTLIERDLPKVLAITSTPRNVVPFRPYAPADLPMVADDTQQLPPLATLQP